MCSFRQLTEAFDEPESYPIAFATGVWAVFGFSGITSAQSGLPVDERTKLAEPVGNRLVDPQAADNDTTKKANLSLWVPEEELQVWDPVNPNVNPMPWRVRIDGRTMFRHLAVGKRVRVEGLAWGYDVDAAVPKSRVFFDGGTVLVTGVDLTKEDVRGRVVRIIGILRLKAHQHPGFELQFPKYYCINAESFEVIEQARMARIVAISGRGPRETPAP